MCVYVCAGVSVGVIGNVAACENVAGQKKRLPGRTECVCEQQAICQTEQITNDTTDRERQRECESE